ncbi:MAG TPA: NEW3 domain-containing protein, partial [Candidatus Polarisedimenticolaceae bacterium]|nr:NEW3 domain-containing protein [Candidatus Polarisedimenticolaceae bacterium]
LYGATFVVAEQGAGVTLLEAPAAVIGQRRIITIVVNMPGASVRSVDGLYHEMSQGQLDWSPDQDGNGQSDVVRVQISAPTGPNCDTATWASAADAAAVAAGVDFSRYQHRLYVLPQSVACTWAGMASVGCPGSCRAFVRTCSLQDVFAHELGHNLGLGHAATDGDNDGTANDTYGDYSDFMGAGGLGWHELNAPHRLHMGWLPAEQVVQPGPGTATYVLSPLEADPATAPYPQVLRYPRPSLGDALYVSYRKRIGYDDGLQSAFADRTSVHSHRGGVNNTLVIDVLQEGDVFTDAETGLTVRQLSHDATSVTLQVSTGCLAAAPTVALAPASQGAQPGQTRSYTLSVTDHDAPGCDPAVLDLTPAAPTGWTASIAPTSLTLDPGETGTATLQVTSPAGAADGSYAVTVHVSGAVDATASYVVDGAAPGPVGAPTATLRPKGGVALAWNAVNGAASYIVLRDGAVLATTIERSYLDRRVTAGVHSYRLRAVDGAGNASAPGPATTITVPTSRGGGGHR